MLAAATSFFARTNISQSYNIGQPPSAGSSSSRPTTPGVPSSSPSAASGSASGSNGILVATFTPTFPVGLWKVQSAYHKVTNKRVSVWSFDKRSSEMERLGVVARERTLEVLKAEVSVSGAFAVGPGVEWIDLLFFLFPLVSVMFLCVGICSESAETSFNSG